MPDVTATVIVIIPAAAAIQLSLLKKEKKN